MTKRWRQNDKSETWSETCRQKKLETPRRIKKASRKRDFETYQKHFRDFEIVPKFSDTHVFWGTILYPLSWSTLLIDSNKLPAALVPDP